MKNLLIVALCLFAAATGCKKKEEGKAAPASSPTENAPAPGDKPADKAPEAAPGGASKAEYKPDEIFKATAGKSHLDLMKMFKDGATVTGTVKEVKDDPAGEYNLVFDAGDGHTVSAMLNDPQPARDKKLKAGDSVTVTKCHVANPSDTDVPLRTCDLK